jgi:integrase
MFTRANRALGANWTLHDLRHTAAYRMEMSDVPFDASFGTVRDQGAAREIGHDAVGVGA